MTNNLTKLSKVAESFTVYRYDNGGMIEINGRDKTDNWATIKMLCNNENELIDLIKEYNQKTLEL